MTTSQMQLRMNAFSSQQKNRKVQKVSLHGFRKEHPSKLATGD